ncbi:hypothetical protein OPT61_g8761 [Boeremia exigua]|uniref:Uncharacterized protein n=1 Tax=Boeremia exigua TaxID=749465 RepID=A0ACC2HXT7_9PLEO|nr:hypothetical protein OPT61_g8761 [Boeremia exigua]
MANRGRAGCKPSRNSVRWVGNYVDELHEDGSVRLKDRAWHARRNPGRLRTGRMCMCSANPCPPFRDVHVTQTWAAATRDHVGSAMQQPQRNGHVMVDRESARVETLRQIIGVTLRGVSTATASQLHQTPGAPSGRVAALAGWTAAPLQREIRLFGPSARWVILGPRTGRSDECVEQASRAARRLIERRCEAFRRVHASTRICVKPTWLR